MVRLPTQLDWDEFYVLFVLRRLPGRGNRTTIESAAQFLVDDLVELQKVYPGWRYKREDAFATCQSWILELADDGYVELHDPPLNAQGPRCVEVSAKGDVYLKEIPAQDPDICELYDTIPWSPKRLLDALAQEG
jgi:hypothetical protein